MASDVTDDSLTLGELSELVEWGHYENEEADLPRLKSLIVQDIIDAFEHNALVDRITLVLLPEAIKYVGKNAVDVLMKIEESSALEKFESYDELDRRIILLYGGNGAVLARIEVPLDGKD